MYGGGLHPHVQSRAFFLVGLHFPTAQADVRLALDVPVTNHTVCVWQIACILRLPQRTMQTDAARTPSWRWSPQARRLCRRTLVAAWTTPGQRAWQRVSGGWSKGETTSISIADVRTKGKRSVLKLKRVRSTAQQLLWAWKTTKTTNKGVVTQPQICITRLWF